jgi:hypothetical protein
MFLRLHWFLFFKVLAAIALFTIHTYDAIFLIILIGKLPISLSKVTLTSSDISIASNNLSL